MLSKTLNTFVAIILISAMSMLNFSTVGFAKINSATASTCQEQASKAIQKAQEAYAALEAQKALYAELHKQIDPQLAAAKGKVASINGKIANHDAIMAVSGIGGFMSLATHLITTLDHTATLKAHVGFTAVEALLGYLIYRSYHIKKDAVVAIKIPAKEVEGFLAQLKEAEAVTQKAQERLDFVLQSKIYTFQCE